MLLEVPVFNINSAIIAATNGADRLELCENYENGGTTPCYGILKTVRNIIKVPVNVMIRPVAGGFVYTALEFEAMKHDILLCKQLGFNGVVLGILKTDGHIDIERTKELVALAHPLEVTFHRAFDRCVDAFKGLEDVISCGCKRLLTSGKKATVFEGKLLLKELVQIAGNRIIIMPGGGLNSVNIDNIINTTNALEFHSSCKIFIVPDAHFTSPAIHDADNKTISIYVEELKRIKALLQ